MSDLGAESRQGPDGTEGGTQTPQIAPALTVRFGNHLFIAGDTNFLNEQHIGTAPISVEVRDAWLRIVNDRLERMTARNVGFLFLLAPDKQTVYRHLLPKTYQFRQAAFLTALDCVIDVAPLLAAMSPLLDVYPQTDSHWNHCGALIAAQSVLARLGKNFATTGIQWHDQRFAGDLGHKVMPTEMSVRMVANIRSRSFMIYDNCVPNNGRIRIWSRKIDDCTCPLTRLMLVGDSFSYDLVHFLKEAFDVVVHVHAFAVDYRLSDAFAPDLIVCEITERFVFRSPKPGDGEPLTQLWQEKVDRRTPLEPMLQTVVADPNVFPARAIEMAQYAEALFASFRLQLKSRGFGSSQT